VTWTSGNTYILTDLIAITEGATLTIEPCVVVKAVAGPTGLLVDQGAKLNAVGTADCPIIFTSTQDELEPGQLSSPNLTGEDVGLWSGLVLLGNAPVSSMPGDNNIFMVLPQDYLFSFGGDAAEDNSGTLEYVSIRHTGAETAPFELPSGLTLCGVGSGTMLNHLELFANADDGLRVIGGNFNLNNLVTSHFDDDAIDIDRGYAGILNNIIGIGGNEDDSALELDGGEGSFNPSFTIQKASFQGSQNKESYIAFRNNVNCLIADSYFFGFDPNAQVSLRSDNEANNWIDELIDVSNLEFNISHLDTGNTSIESIFQDTGDNTEDAFSTRLPNASIVSQPSVGADKTAFTGWTLADLVGALDEF
ncbi:MAG: hypothetical protein AAFU60_11050, partial [Bacteroidota bacterium]